MRLIAIFIASSKTWRHNVVGHGGGTLGNKMTTLSHFSSANSTGLQDMLTCQVDAHYLHTELKSSLSKQMDRPKLKKTYAKLCIK
jgi:hypothetical protein